jgi:hypothetical protein
MCAHPEGMHEHVPLKPGEDPPTTCFAAGCDCEPVVFVRADLHRGAVEEAERLRAALRWYAIGDHFPHPDYSARAQAALRSTTGGQ